MSQQKQSSEPGIDFFDVDHTIVDGATGLDSVITGIRLGVLPMRIVFSIPAWYRLYFKGGEGVSGAQLSLRELTGLPRATVEWLGHANFDKRVRRKIYPGAEAQIRDLIAAGREVVFVTSSFTHLVKPLADHLRVRKVLANALIYENDKTTGRLVEPFLFGKEKLVQALRYMAARGIDPQHCSFFSDSVYDLPLLEAVGRPVAVNPDRKLLAIARKRNWEIVRFER